MKELVLDKYGRIICNEDNSVRSLNSFLEAIDNPNCNNSIAPFSKNTYLVKLDDEDYCLSSVDSKTKRKINKYCKEISKRENLKKSLSLNYINSSSISRLINDVKTNLALSNKSVFKSIKTLLIAFGIAIYGIAGTPLMAYLALSGVIDSIPIVFVILILLGCAPSFMVAVVGLNMLIEGDISFRDIIDEFKELSKLCKDRKLNVNNLKELKTLSKKFNAYQPESSKQENIIIPIDDKIELIMQESSELDTCDRKLILEDLKNIIEKYNVNDKETKKKYYKSAEVQAKLVGELKALESNISLLIRRKNLEKTLFDCSEHNETETQKEEQGPARKLTQQN